MAGNDAALPLLLPKRIPVNKLVLGKTMQHVLVRVLRMWEARNFKLNGTLMSLDLLLLDEMENLIQGSIFHRRIDRFKNELMEGSIYPITDFEVVPTYNHYKVTYNPFTIRFTDNTQIIEIAEADCSIKKEKFRLHTYAEFHNFAGSNLHLLDVVGQILQAQGSNMQDSSSKQKIILLLLLEDNSTIRLTLWDDQASAFRQQIKQTDRNCSVIVCTCLNPKMFAGKLHLNSTGATRLYIDNKLEVVKKFMIMMGIKVSDVAATIVEETGGKFFLEIWTIKQISDYISSGGGQEKEVICHGKILDISTRNGWKYLSCASCSKKLGRSATSLICNSCDNTTTIGIARFRVELEVESDEKIATFVLFDRDARNLTNTTAEEISLTEGVNLDMAAPKCLLELVGTTFYFQIKISEYNFQNSMKTITVTRIVDENLIKEDAKEEGGREIKTEDGKISPTFATAIDVANMVNKLGGEVQLEEKDPIPRELSENEPKRQRIV